ncbi:MAG: polyprenyl diphosphate synthase [Patescibacteria group bacterium]
MTPNKASQLKTPIHIGIILDGNRRWARAHGLPTLEGHRRGYDKVKEIAVAAFEQGVKVLTVYAFSTENWRRQKSEVAYLLKLFRLFVGTGTADLARQGIRLNFFGRRQDFDRSLQTAMQRVEQATKNNQRGVLNICLSYGGRDEIIRAMRKLAARKISPAKITEELISRNLDSAGWPDPDLIIRTSGEQRLSGFLTWQSVYSELYFVKKHWPDFSGRDLAAAIREYGRRQRRYGK